MFEYKKDYVTYYDYFDKDKYLFVKKGSLIHKSEEVVFCGSEKACRLFAIANNKTKKIKRRWP